MKHIFLSAWMIAALISAGVSTAQAQTEPVNVTTSAVPFLRISPDARAGGMGDLGLATSADANAVFYNLAKIPFAAKKSSIGVTYTPWMKDIAADVFLLSAGGYHQIDESQAFGVSLRYFNIGDLPISDYSGQKLMTTQPRELSFDAGYARKLSDHLGLSVALRYINSKLATGNINGNDYKAASAVAGDVSLFYTGVDSSKVGWSAGLALRNLGSKIGYTTNEERKEFLPASFGAGVAYTAVMDEANKITLGVDYNKLLTPKSPVDAAGLEEYYSKGVMDGWFSSFNNKSYTISLGAEYSYQEKFSLRAGYIIVPDAAGDNGGLTAGLGIGLNVVKVNFSYLAAKGSGSTRNPLSNTLRFGLVFDMK
jgi:hypothetical protein